MSFLRNVINILVMDDLVTLISGRRFNRSVDYVCSEPDMSQAVIVMAQKPVLNEYGDCSVTNCPSFHDPSFRLVPDVDAQEFSIASILRNGNLPSLVPTAGGFDPISAQKQGAALANDLNFQLSNIESNTSDDGQ